MNIKHIRLEDTKTSSWTQGETTEYYIYPESCDYANKDFLFRVSSATINEQPARFTLFIGYTRYLMMLDNEVDISINRNRATYHKQQTIKFHSEDDTIAYSTGKDFNLMIKEDIKEHSVEINHGFFEFENSFILVYSLQACEVFIDSFKYILEANECLVIENEDRKAFELISTKEIIIAKLNLIPSSEY